MSRSKKKPQAAPRDLLGLLTHAGHLSPDSRRQIEAFAARWDVSPFTAVLETHLMGEAELADALAAALGLDRLHHLAGMAIASEALSVLTFPRARAEESLVLREDDGRLELVVCDPTRHEALATLRADLGFAVTLAVTERSVLVKAIDEMYPISAQLPTLLGGACREV